MRGYLPENQTSMQIEKNAQEAHEAIRLSDVRKKGSDLTSIERDAQRLYELIWRQFVACQMTPAEYLTTTIKIEANRYGLKRAEKSQHSRDTKLSHRPVVRAMTQRSFQMFKWMMCWNLLRLIRSKSLRRRPPGLTRHR